VRKLGLIAGGGKLPVEIAAHCEQSGRPFFIVRLRGFAGSDIADYPGVEIGVAELGKCFKVLRRAGCETVSLVGTIERPDFRSLKPDLRGLKLLPAAIAAAHKGDDALLRLLVREFEKEGFSVEGAHEVMGDLTLPEGALGKVQPRPEHFADIERALSVAQAIGRLDVGQGAVSCEGLILAAEAQEGTDAMLRRVTELPLHLRGQPGALRGVLAKAPKPIQDTRVDLPTIGLGTIQRAAQAGLAGIVGEAGHLLVLDRDAVIELADELGMFILGLEPRER
jgi:UDP-2,3-diacylglucosamine hydrolase